MFNGMPLRRNWVTELSNCLTAVEREQTGSSCPVVDHEIVRGPGGTAEDATVWLICRNRSEQRLFTDTELSRFAATLRRRMLAAGFPENAVDGFPVRVTSREEVEQRGGYSFFR